MTTGFVTRFKGRFMSSYGSLFQFGKGSGTFGASGNIFTYASGTGVGNGADTTEDVLKSFALPANSLDAVGRALWIYAFGSYANDTDTKAAKLYFGTSITLAAATGQNLGWALELLVMKTGANTQIANGQTIVGTTHGGTTLPLAGTETDTAAITIKVTGHDSTAATANAIVLNGLMIGAFD